jgi:predicted nucleotidyltransferase
MGNLKAEVLSFLRQEKPRLQAIGISSVGCFGSVVRGEERPDSDIDILIDVQADSSLSLFSLLSLEQEYSERLHHKVDLVIKADLRPRIGQQILAEVEYV